MSMQNGKFGDIRTPTLELTDNKTRM